MKRLAIGFAVIGLLVAAPASGHRADLLTAAGRVGPIERGETRYRDVKQWFGEPSSYKVVRVGCVRLPRVRWGTRLEMIIGRRSAGRTVQQVIVKKPVIQSREHGPLTFHTRKGLEVGDSEKRLRRLYPNAQGQTHSGHTHYSLNSGLHGRMLARVENGRVVNILVGPYEFC